MPEKDSISLTKQDLADIISQAIAAAKAPNVIEQQKLDAQAEETKQKQEYRKSISLSVKEDMENKRAVREVCSHEHANGNSRSVWVQEPKGYGYMICLKNQCKIRPEPKPAKNADNGCIYNTALFNRLFQKAQSVEEFA
jgi:hypothetical protein